MRPKFTVDEQVIFVKTGERVVIKSMEYDDNRPGEDAVTGEHFYYTGWSYLLDIRGSNWVVEDMLRKLPPEERLSWEDMMSQFNKEVV